MVDASTTGETDLIYAYRFDGEGGGDALTWDDIDSGVGDRCFYWLHFERTGDRAQGWLREKSGLDEPVCDALLAEESRPRCTAFPDGLFINLRGVNLNPGADPEDMVSIRMWVDENRIISTRRRRLLAAGEIAQKIERGRGPNGPGDFLVALTTGLMERMGAVISDLDDSVDDLEDKVLGGETREIRTRLAQLRREAISLRRYIAPQREALARLAAEPVAWLTGEHRALLREVDNRITRYVEDLDAARERAAITQDELQSRLSEQMNRTMYLLSVIAGIFLPLGLLTGLLGINVAGMPGAETPWAFAAVCVLMVALGAFEVWLFRRFRWI